ncbi:L,D-transpeptidase family protein [Streptomyces sp. NPDC058657]|uniref:L,D-transpeptidase n=1 Tax=unclassified Streptomyces TaxID=2593676 RepID=UPI003662F123
MPDSNPLDAAPTPHGPPSHPTAPGTPQGPPAGTPSHPTPPGTPQGPLAGTPSHPTPPAHPDPLRTAHPDPLPSEHPGPFGTERPDPLGTEHPDPLTTALRDLADTAGTTAPRAGGAHVRHLAERRRRRRRAVTTGAVTTVAASLALLLGTPFLSSDEPAVPPPPAASPVQPPPPVATVDLAARQLTVRPSDTRNARTVPITAGRKATPTRTGRLTVTALDATRTLSGKLIGLVDDYDYRASWVVELRAPDGYTTYALAFPHTSEGTDKSKEFFGRVDATDGSVGMPQADAKWLFQQLHLGDTIEIH